MRLLRHCVPRNDDEGSHRERSLSVILREHFVFGHSERSEESGAAQGDKKGCHCERSEAISALEQPCKYQDQSPTPPVIASEAKQSH